MKRDSDVHRVNTRLADSRDELGALYRESHFDMVRLAFLITGSNAVAEDVVHDAFVSIQKKWDGIRNPKAYLHRSVVNGSRSYLRKLRVQRNSQVPPPQPVLPTDVDETWQLLQALPSRRRTALVLHYYMDLPIDEIAALMETRPGTVKSLLHRGRETLRKQMT